MLHFYVHLIYSLWTSKPWLAAQRQFLKTSQITFMLRRRNQAPMADLTTPLLAKNDREFIESADQAFSALPSEESTAATRTSVLRPLPPLGDNSPSSWWRNLLFKLTYLYDELLDFIYWHLWTRIRHLSLLQTSRLEQLKDRAAVVYNAEQIEHQQHLQRLWQAAFPGMHFPPGVKSAQWKVMGWQGEDPASDFRGGGFLSLELLVHFAERHPDKFEALMKKTHGNRSEWEYPFAAAGVNITFMLVEVLELKKVGSDWDINNNKYRPVSKTMIGFLRILESNEYALEELFIESFILLDKIWLQQGASYMEFPHVLKEVNKRVRTVLKRRWLKDVDDIKSIHY